MTEAIIANETLTNDHFVQSVQQLILNQTAFPVLAIGGGTKSGLVPKSNATPVEMKLYQGVVTYDPSEYLITAKAGTSIMDLQEVLAQHGQFLPFDPLWSSRGATIGGTIASGISGPDRLLYGGVRDFIMEVAMVDGLGRVVRGGGKVVKNAAGFDTPKLLVGSYGRLGVIVEATVKVFPSPQAFLTMVIPHGALQQAIQSMQRVLSKPLPISSVVIDSQSQLSLRIAGPRDSLSGVVDRIRKLLPDPGNAIVMQEDLGHRNQLLNWLESELSEDELLLRIGVSPKDVVGLQTVVEGTEHYHLGACSVTWVKISTNEIQGFHAKLESLGLSAVVVRGEPPQTFIGNRGWLSMAEKIQHAIDPQHRFVAWN